MLQPFATYYDMAYGKASMWGNDLRAILCRLN